MLLNNLLPAEIVVIADVLAAALPHAIVAGTISVVMLMIGDVSAGGLVLILYLLALLVVAGLGVAFPIAYFAFVIRDLQNLIGVLLLVLLLSSPITLDLSQIEGLRAAAVYLNPLSYWILPVRAACRTDGVVQVHHVALATLMALGSFSGGLWLFSSIKRHLGQYA